MTRRQDNGILYPPNPVRDRLHRTLFGFIGRLGPALQGHLLRGFFDRIYLRRNPWHYEGTPYQRQKCDAALAVIPRQNYARVLEVGCGEGLFSELLLEDRSIGELIGLDISARAVQRAGARCARFSNARFEAENALTAPLTGAFDLIIACEVLYYLGAALAPLAERLAQHLTPTGRIVLVHPWPQAEELHRTFVQSGGYVILNESLVRDPCPRPFCVSVLTVKGVKESRVCATPVPLALRGQDFT